MTRVAMLAHVKESTIVEPPPLPSRVGARIAWTGGKIVSNKNEALRKFYERKLKKDALTPEQRRALEDSIAKLGDVSPMTASKPTGKHHKSKHDVVHKINPVTKRMAHRAHVKVASHSKKTLVVNGRVVGPRVENKANTARGTKPTPKKNASRPASSFRKSSDESIALQDKLGMSLDALVKRNTK